MMVKSLKRLGILTCTVALLLALALSVSLMDKSVNAADIDDIESTSFAGGVFYDNYRLLRFSNACITDRTSNRGSVANAFDDNVNTRFDVALNGTDTQIFLNFGGPAYLTGWTQITRNDNNIYGTMSWWKIYTSDDATTYNNGTWDLVSEGTSPYVIGTWDFFFDGLKKVNKLKIVTDAVAISELMFYYVPGSENEITAMDTEINALLANAGALEGSGLNQVDSSLLAALQAEKAAIGQLPSTTAEEKLAKAQRLFALGANIKRAVNVETTSLSAPLAVAKTALNSAVAGTTPLYWLEADIDAFRTVCETAQALTAKSLGTQGEVGDSLIALNTETELFNNKNIKPVITMTDGFVKRSDESRIFPENLIDGMTQNKFILGNSTNFDGAHYIEFNYLSQIKFESIKIGTWWAKDQGAKKVKLEYYDSESETWKPITGGTGASGKVNYSLSESGIYTFNWTTNTGNTEWETLNFTVFESAAVRLYPLSGSSGGVFIIDELEIGIQVSEVDMDIVMVEDTVTISEYDTYQIIALATPFYAKNKNVTWNSDNPAVLEVDANGLVTAGSIGAVESVDVTVTVTTEYGNKTADCVITVIKAVYEITGSGQGFNIIAEAGSSSPVSYGGSYSFKINLTMAYSNSTDYTVKANGNPITAAEGIYTVQNITEAQVITVEGLTLNTYTVTVPAIQTHYALTPEEGSSSTVNYNGSYLFRIEIDPRYDNSPITVKANGDASLTPGPNGIYTIANIIENKTITVEGLVINSYQVTLPDAAGYIAAAKSGSASPVNDGDSYSFTVGISTGYEVLSMLAVKANGNLITALEGVYIIENITCPQVITVEGATPIVYNINYHLESVEINGANPASYTIETGLITLLNASKENYTFIGWYTAETDGTRVETIAAGTYGNKDLYPRFEINSYSVTLPAGTGYTAAAESGSASPVTHGGSYSFKINLEAAYSQSVIVINVDGNLLLPDDAGIYTVLDITSVPAITVDGVAINSYAVTLPAGTGYTAVVESGSASPVSYGGNYSFRIILDALYSGSAVAVKADGNSLTPNGFGIYTILNITSVPAITVDGVAINSYSVTLPAGAGYTAVAESGSASPVSYGGSYSFRINLDEAYSNSEITVIVNGIILNGSDGVYTIEDIMEAQEIIVGGVVINSTAVVTFNTNGGNTVSPVTVSRGEKVSKPAEPVKAGYEFVGWYSDSELNAEFDFDTSVSADITLYAKWNEESQANGGCGLAGIVGTNSGCGLKIIAALYAVLAFTVLFAKKRRLEK